MLKSQIREVRLSSAGRSRLRVVRTQALFGWGKKDNAKDIEKEEAFLAQQELLAKRKNGDAIKEANQRRGNVKATVAARKAERKQERDLLAQGIMPDTLANWKPYKKKEDAEANSGIVVPLLPFGLRQYDEGERFDLRSPYADDGWVDPEETDMFAGFKNFGKKFLNFSGKEPEPQQGKPILWASEYGKVKKDKDSKQGRK